jgi:hypothetical protein
MTGTFDLLADLPVEIDGYKLEGLKAEVSSGFERLSTVVHLTGGDHEGVGEDVVYDGVDQTALQEAGPVHDLAGRYALGDFCALIDSLDLFPVEPQRDVSRLYRRCARLDVRSTRSSAATPVPSPSSSRCDSASLRRSTPSPDASSAIRRSASSSTPRAPGIPSSSRSSSLRTRSTRSTSSPSIEERWSTSPPIPSSTAG